MAEDICHRLHFSNDDTQQIVALVANHMRFADVEKHEGIDAETVSAAAAV